MKEKCMVYTLVEFPVDLGDAPLVLLRKLTGQEVEQKLLLRATYHMVGYGLNKVGEVVAQPQMLSTDLTTDDLVGYLEQLDKGALAVSSSNIPWELVISSLFKLLELWKKK
jgi:hypothetical protein